MVAKEKELSIKQKEIEIQHQKNLNDKQIEKEGIAIKKEKAELRVHILSSIKQILLILGSMKLLIITIAIYSFGWGGVWKFIKGFFTIDGFFGWESKSGGGKADIKDF
jgi:hypothetical protein